MPDPLTALSTAASVVSLVDVTIRACEGIYGLVISWRNAPRAVKSLRQTVEGIESILRSLKTFVTEYESSVAFRQHRQVLPDSVNADIISIGETLGLLDGILTSSGETKNVRRRAKWAIDEKKTLEIVQRLETQQVALILSLQTVAQRSSIARHHDMFRIETNLKQSHPISTEQVLNALKPISRRLDVIAQNEASASMGHASLSTSIEALRETNLDLHNTLDGKLDNLMSGLSQAPFLRDSIRSEIFVRPSTNDVLARIFREELKHVVIPIVEDRLKANKSASEAQIVSIRESIDSMASEFQQNLNYEDSDELITFLRCQVLEIDDVKADELAEQLRHCLNVTPFFKSAGIGYGFYATQRTYYLCGLGANVRARDASGRQPLHYLFQKPWSDETSCHVIYLAYLLIKTGADIWACDDRGNTPTSLVLKHDRWDDWCKILERCGLDVEHVLRTERDNRWDRQHLNDAERSSVDTEDLEFPGHEVSLRRRGAYTREVDG
ncbi:hypothetical protein HO133_001955 [Letharia lupina]|uniref:Azaphilone pigments biosynthesis cluster protein L N-terminal domain-containing protein n=1 Tax=Letharia lupina TaxID=560253 RepID=A0A8H6CEH8_9LECA|nr:uncharacterized protein HO133_001955 [Letharia lupina]KAF6221987.1 hypothetical protein HO133_001955 [Letharia lupina]